MLESLPMSLDEEVIKKNDHKGQRENDLKERMEREKMEKQRLENILKRLDDDYAINDKAKNLGGILKWQIESGLQKRIEIMKMMEMQEMMTDLMKEQKHLKNQEEKEGIDKETW